MHVVPALLAHFSNRTDIKEVDPFPLGKEKAIVISKKFDISVVIEVSKKVMLLICSPLLFTDRVVNPTGHTLHSFILQLSYGDISNCPALFN